jgi:HEAT repeat protein
MGESASPAISALLESLGDPDHEVKVKVATALGAFGLRAKAALPQLIDELHNTDRRDPAFAEAIGKIGSEAREAIPALISALDFPYLTLDDTFGAIRQGQAYVDAVVDALVKIGPEAIPPLLEILDKSDYQGRTLFIGRVPNAQIVVIYDYKIRAAEAISLMKDNAKEFLPQIRKLLKDPIEGVRFNAALALGNIGPDAKSSATELRELLRDAPAVRAAAAWALGEIGAEPNETVAALSKVLSESHDDAKNIHAIVIRVLAVQALAKFGPDAASAIPSLEKAMTTEIKDNPFFSKQTGEGEGTFSISYDGLRNAVVVRKSRGGITLRDEAAKSLRRIKGE